MKNVTDVKLMTKTTTQLVHCKKTLLEDDFENQNPLV